MHERGLRRWSSARKGAWGLGLGIALVLVTALGCAYWLERLESHAVENWRAQLSGIADERKAGFERWIRKWEADAETIARYPTAVYLAAARQGGPRPFPVEEGAAGHLSRLLTAAQATHGHESAWLLRSDGSVLASTTTERPDARFAARIVEQGRTEVVLTAATGRWRALIGAPVRETAAPARTVGVVVLAADARNSLFELLQGEAVRTRTGESLLVHREGERVALASHLRGAPAGLTLPLGTPELAASAAVSGRSEFGRYQDYRGKRVLAAVRPLALPGWGLVVKIDEDEALAQSRAEARQIGVAVLGLVLALGGLAFGLSRQQAVASRLALARSEARFGHLLEQASDAILFVRPDGGIERANGRAEELYGYTRSQLEAMRVQDLYPAGDVGLVAARMAAVREQSGLVFDATHRARDGSLVPVEVSSRFHPSEGVFVSIVRDLTSRQRAEEELRRTQEQLQHSQRLESIGRLAGGVAHDFNNLLGVIIGYTEMVHGTLGPSHPSSSRLKHVLAAAQRAAGLTSQLLAFSRRQVLTPRILDLNAEIAALAAMLRRVIGDDIELDIRCDPRLGRVRADSGQVSQVVLNLAVNARDAMPGGGRLTIETMNLDVDEAYAHAHPPISPGPYVCVRVRDDGSGMPESVRERCFEPFFTTKAEGLGSGLGLATVYGIVRQSDGFIRVESSPGAGTTFTIELPRVAGDPEQAAKSTPVAPEGRGEAILVVEDEEQVRELAKTVLQQAGYEVVTASNGAEALRLADTDDRPLHLLLSDIAMPGMNGYELAERLRLKRPGLRTLLMSGYAREAAAEAVAAHARILEKPFDRVTLLQCVREALSSEHA